MYDRRILFLLRQPPYGTSHALESLETVLVAGVFEQRVSVLFQGDAVWQLVAGQDGALVGRRTLGKVVKALPQYDVSALYVCAASLASRGLEIAELTVTVEALDADAQRALIAAQDAVVTD